MTTPLHWLDATAQAALVRSGQASPLELVDHTIARIEALDPALNAVILRRFDRARAEAAAAGPRGAPFHGVPLLLKDAVCHSAGDPYHFGMRALRDAGYVTPDDTVLAQRFKAAGFIVVGRTNTPEFAASSTTEPLAYGPTHNPWRRGTSPGGSSGGAGAAVAAGLVPVAHGNDMGGSIRIPAAWCGLVGLKPSRGRTTLAPHHGESFGPLTHEHVLTRTVRDTAAVLDVVAGYAPGDPCTAPPPLRPFADEVGAAPGRLRIGVRTRRPDGRGEADPECVAAVEGATRVLAALGHHVEVVEHPALDDPAAGRGLLKVYGVWTAREVDRFGARLGRVIELDELEPHNAASVERGRALSARDYIDVLESMAAYARRVSAFWSTGFDVLVTPTTPRPPHEHGVLGPLAEVGAGRAEGVAAFTVPFNVTGEPAISLPLHWTADGLPVGVQLVAPYGQEAVLLRLAAQLEQAMPWSDRHPPGT